MRDVLAYILHHLAENPDNVQIAEEENDNTVTFYITCDSSDMGRIIGKGGKVIKSLRKLLAIIALKEGKRVNITMVDPTSMDEDQAPKAEESVEEQAEAEAA